MDWTGVAIQAGKVLVIFHAILGAAAFLTWFERRFAGWAQYRVGPNRVGPFGLLQPVADLVKFLFKECPVPDGAHPLLFRFAPLFAAIPALMTFAFVPFGGEVSLFGRQVKLVGANIEVGAIFVLAIGSLSVYGIILGGWAANNKYSLLGGLRSSAQVISYELAMVLAVVGVIALSGTLNLYEIVQAQEHAGWWNIFRQPIGFIVFFVAAFAETNRHPFDFAECEAELVGGFHTEYASMKFALYFVGEYAAMMTMSGLMTTLYLGGPLVPGLALAQTPWWAGVLAFTAKTGMFLFVFMLVRWSFPRLKFNQLMSLGWKILLPLAILNIALTGAGIVFL